jgi:cephalosporin-C deacetylase-like acetyl esterase
MTPRLERFARVGRLAIVGLLAALSVAALAAEQQVRLSVRTDRPDAVYAKGETATFTIELTGAASQAEPPHAECEVSTDAFWHADKTAIGFLNGKAQLTASRDFPCVLWVRVTYGEPAPTPEDPKAERKVQAVGGAAFSPQEIAPSMPAPDDFDAFWAQQRARVDAIPPTPVLEPAQSPDPKVDLFSITMDNINETKVYGYLAKPKGDGPFPGYFQPQWAGVYSLDPAWAVGRAQQGFIALNINAHAIPNGKPPEYYRALDAGALKGYPYQGRESRETCYFLRMYLSDYRAIEYLVTRPEWDKKHLVVSGGSQGGGQAIVTAALDSHVTAVAADVPAMCDLTAVVAGRASGWPMLVAVKDGKPDPVQLQAARYFDVVNFAREVEVPVMIGTGFADLVCPASSVFAAYNALPGPKEMVIDPLSDHQRGMDKWWKASWDFFIAHGKD